MLNVDGSPQPLAPISAFRSVVGWLLKYIASNALTMVLAFCAAALVVSWITWSHTFGLAHALGATHPSAVPAGATVQPDSIDLGSVIGWGYFICTLLLTALAYLWRKLRHRRSTPPVAGAPPAHGEMHVRRRLWFAFGIVSVIYAGAFAALPFLRMAHGSSRLGMAVALVVMYLLALVFTALFEAFDIAADRVLAP